MLRYYPSYFYNSLTLGQSAARRVVRLSVDADAHTFVSLHQQDARLFDESYTYSYFRLGIARVVGEELECVSIKLECRRNIVFERFLTAGEYVLLVEPIWCAGGPVEFTLSSYSSAFVFLAELEQVTAAQFNRMELLLWRSYCEANQGALVDKYTSRIVEADFAMWAKQQGADRRGPARQSVLHAQLQRGARRPAAVRAAVRELRHAQLRR